MQIYEITQPQQQNTQIDEVVGGLARMAGQAIAGSRVGQAVGQAVGGAKQAFQQSTVGQTLQRAQDIQAQAKLSGQQSMIAKTLYDQWNRKVMALTNAAGGQPVNVNEYEDQLRDFIEKVVLNNRRILDLDQPSQDRIETSITDIMKNQSNRDGLQKAFQNLATQASVARADPAKQQQVPNPAQMIQRMQSGAPLRKTGNPAVDQLLAALGVPLQP